MPLSSWRSGSESSPSTRAKEPGPNSASVNTRVDSNTDPLNCAIPCDLDRIVRSRRAERAVRVWVAPTLQVAGARPSPHVERLLVQRLQQVGDQVVRALDAHRVADQVVLDPDRFALLGGQL